MILHHNVRRYTASSVLVQRAMTHLEACLDTVCGGAATSDVVGTSLQSLADEVATLLPGVVAQAHRWVPSMVTRSLYVHVVMAKHTFWIPGSV
jgi:hypothetical protein